ncbi:CERS1 synthase, partial [Furnarius figulus]|nr:CERS1 synthase [Furnarius figulus]
CNLQPKDAAKMPESAWKLLFYTLSWSYGTYLLFFTDYPFFYDPPSVFYGTVRARRALAWLGCPKEWEVGWEKDKTTPKFPLLWGQEEHKGLSLFPSDTQHGLEGVEWINQERINSWNDLGGPNWGSSAGSALFWGATKPTMLLCPGRFWFRLYWFPLKVLYATCYSSLQSVPDIPFYFFFNALLLILTLMNIYWFLYIVLFVAKVLMGQMQEVNDVREYDVEDTKKS